jgi:hypothetical protein
MKGRAAGVIIGFAAALSLAGAGPVARSVWAGGGGFGADDEDQDAGPPFLGLVQDQAGNNIADARITVTIATMNSTLVLRSDTVGHFFVRGFDKTVDPKDVKIICNKDGYAEATATAAPAAGNAPIQVVCVLKKE